jgi:hypothetical protein
VNEDRYLTNLSGFTAYLNKEVIMGAQWWKYVGLSTRVIQSTVVFGLDFNSDSYLLLSRLIQTSQCIFLTGMAGIKFYLTKNKVESIGNVTISQS